MRGWHAAPPIAGHRDRGHAANGTVWARSALPCPQPPHVRANSPGGIADKPKTISAVHCAPPAGCVGFVCVLAGRDVALPGWLVLGQDSAHGRTGRRPVQPGPCRLPGSAAGYAGVRFPADHGLGEAGASVAVSRSSGAGSGFHRGWRSRRSRVTAWCDPDMLVTLADVARMRRRSPAFAADRARRASPRLAFRRDRARAVPLITVTHRPVSWAAAARGGREPVR